ncbi:MAG: tetratricopeptide repeat protein [Thermoguttaceae bacterium]
MTPMQQYDACVDMHRRGNESEALEALMKLIEEHADFSLGYNAIAAIYKKRGDLSKAIQYIEKYCELEPTDSFGFSVLSAYSIEAGERGKAEDALGRVNDIRMASCE